MPTTVPARHPESDPTMTDLDPQAGAIRYELNDGIAVITIDRPSKKNAMTFAMLRDFIDAVGAAGNDAAVRAIVVTGAGGVFCAGIDLADLSGRSTDDRGATGRPGGWHLTNCLKPVIAAVSGTAVGMGAEFATQADLRVVSLDVRIAWNFVHRGLVPDTGAATWLLPRTIGLAPASRYLYSGDFMNAEEAVRLNFATVAVPPDDVLSTAIELARSVSKGSPFAVERTKRLLLAGFSRSVDEHLEANAAAMRECFASDDHREGVASFLERRPANFTGK